MCRGLRVLADWIEQQAENLYNTECGWNNRSSPRALAAPCAARAAGESGVAAVAGVLLAERRRRVNCGPVLPATSTPVHCRLSALRAGLDQR